MRLELKKFCNFIDHNFSNENLLEEALTHPSFSKENKISSNYQRLEFLGDKVLNLAIGELLFKKYPHEAEGDLSKRQAALISGEFLAQIALKIGLDEVLQVSKGEKKMGGKSNKRNLENSLEALVGAIYIDTDFEKAKKFITKFWSKDLKTNILVPKDAVSQLQELVQLKSKELPQYFTNKVGGSDHAPQFVSTIKIPFNDLQFSASGKSKKEAQKEVSKIALEQLLKV
jgi:ribonuclease-3